MEVVIHAGAQLELSALRQNSVAEHGAMLRAINKLEIFGIKLPFPWTSHVQGTDLWELRPLRGRSPWRAFYQRQGNVLRIGAIGHDAKVDKQGFNAAVDRARTRLQTPSS